MPLPQPLPLEGVMPAATAAAAQVAQSVPGLVAGGTPAVGRKQRELYVGNLPVGMITAAALKELFSQPLRTMPGYDESTGPPCLNIDLSADGKFAFVEFRDEAITTIALTLFDKMELCGRPLNVGRPRGYIEPGSQPALGLPTSLPLLGGQPPAPPPAPIPPAVNPAATRCIRLDKMITSDMLEDDEEYKDVLEDIRLECERFGKVEQVKIPRQGEPNVGACFVLFADKEGAAKGQQMLHNRQFDGNSVVAAFIPETDF